MISEVLSTFQQDAEGIPQGNMAGHGVSVGKTNGFTYTAEEHCYIIGIVSVLPKTAYQQGIPKHFLRRDKFDFYWPEFAHLGEQVIDAGELYYEPFSPAGTHRGIFGYTPRYSEYKFNESSVHGEMRDQLAYWHMGRIFDTFPQLNEGFVTSDPTNRIFAVTDQNPDKMYAQIYNRVDALRPMPYFGTPSF